MQFREDQVEGKSIFSVFGPFRAARLSFLTLSFTFFSASHQLELDDVILQLVDRTACLHVLYGTRPKSIEFGSR